MSDEVMMLRNQMAAIGIDPQDGGPEPAHRDAEVNLNDIFNFELDDVLESAPLETGVTTTTVSDEVAAFGIGSEVERWYPPTPTERAQRAAGAGHADLFDLELDGFEALFVEPPTPEVPRQAENNDDVAMFFELWKMNTPDGWGPRPEDRVYTYNLGPSKVSSLPVPSLWDKPFDLATRFANPYFGPYPFFTCFYTKNQGKKKTAAVGIPSVNDEKKAESYEEEKKKKKEEEGESSSRQDDEHFWGYDAEFERERRAEATKLANITHAIVNHPALRGTDFSSFVDKDGKPLIGLDFVRSVCKGKSATQLPGIISLFSDSHDSEGHFASMMYHFLKTPADLEEFDGVVLFASIGYRGLFFIEGLICKQQIWNDWAPPYEYIDPEEDNGVLHSYFWRMLNETYIPGVHFDTHLPDEEARPDVDFLDELFMKATVARQVGWALLVLYNAMMPLCERREEAFRELAMFRGYVDTIVRERKFRHIDMVMYMHYAEAIKSFYPPQLFYGFN